MNACFGFLDGRPQHEHGDQYARALLRRPICGCGDRRVCRHLHASGARRLHRDGSKNLGTAGRFRDRGCRNFALPRSATARKNDAVLHPDRRDDLLSRAFATAGAGGGASCGSLGVAVYRACAGQRGHFGNSCHDRLQSDVGRLARAFQAAGGGVQDAAGFWINQVNSDGQAIINAARSERQGVRLTGLTVFRFDNDNQFKERIEAQEATLEDGYWLFKSVHRYTLDSPPVDQDSLKLATSLTAALVRNGFSTTETVSFWQLPGYIRSSESSGFATAGYRLQYHKLIAQPFLLAAMVMLAASVSLRFFRFGGVQKMVLSGVGAGFLLYVLSKVTEDLSKAELMHPIASAWLPVCVGGLTGFLALLYQEDG